MFWGAFCFDGPNKLCFAALLVCCLFACLFAGVAAGVVAGDVGADVPAVRESVVECWSAGV